VRLSLFNIALAAVFLLSACGIKKDPLQPSQPPQPTLATSSKKLRFKRSKVLANDFSKVLGLERASLCNELGKFDCTGLIHQGALGDVDPTFVLSNGRYTPSPETGVITTLAVERVALSACLQRVEMDFIDFSAALIFTGLPVDPSGNLSNAYDPAVTSAIDTLYKRALLRPASDQEIAHLRFFYTEIHAEQSIDAARAWAQLSCFAVLTSVESLFY